MRRRTHKICYSGDLDNLETISKADSFSHTGQNFRESALRGPGGGKLRLPHFFQQSTGLLKPRTVFVGTSCGLCGRYAGAALRTRLYWRWSMQTSAARLPGYGAEPHALRALRRLRRPPRERPP